MTIKKQPKDNTMHKKQPNDKIQMHHEPKH